VAVLGHALLAPTEEIEPQILVIENDQFMNGLGDGASRMAVQALAGRRRRPPRADRPLRPHDLHHLVVLEAGQRLRDDGVGAV
jgi:hypothetical protein